MYKCRLLELCQKQKWGTPEYKTAREGPDHNPRFQSTVTVRGLSFNGPQGLCSAKDAQNEAAALAFRHLSASPPPPGSCASSYGSQVDHFLPTRHGTILHNSHVSSSVQPSKQTAISDAFLYKSKLQEFCHKKQWSLPKYDVAKDGPDHMPCFQATVDIGGLSFEGPAACRSSREAQDKAARIAFDHFSGVNHHSQVVDSDFSQVDASILVDDRIPIGSEVSKGSPDDATDSSRQYTKQIDILENGIPCKSQLQSYAQKRKLMLPSYDFVREGSIHTFRYKARVTIGGQVFECQQFFSSQKEAENAAAKVALVSLLAEADQEDDPVVYKNILLEIIKKEGLPAAVYDTVCEGPPHMPLFLSTVEIGGEKFKGITAKTKKQAEQHAAKAAWLAMKERQKQRTCGNMPMDMDTYSEVEAFISQLPQLTISPATRSDVSQSTSSSAKLETGDKSKRRTGGKEGSGLSGSEQSASTDKPQFLQPASNAGADVPLGRDSSQPCRKIQVYPRRPELKLPDGARVLPMSDDKWVAVEVAPTST